MERFRVTRRSSRLLFGAGQGGGVEQNCCDLRVEEGGRWGQRMKEDKYEKRREGEDCGGRTHLHHEK